MVKITPDNIGAKIGKMVNPKTCKDLSVADKHVDDVGGSWDRFVELERLDLSKNWLQFVRQVEAVFAAPQLRDLDLRGNAVCKVKNYRLSVLSRCPQLTTLDGEEVSDAERGQARAYASGNFTDPLGAADPEAERRRRQELDQAKRQDAAEREARAREAAAAKAAKSSASAAEADEVARLLAGGDDADDGAAARAEEEAAAERRRAEEAAEAERAAREQAAAEAEAAKVREAIAAEKERAAEVLAAAAAAPKAEASQAEEPVAVAVSEPRRDSKVRQSATAEKAGRLNKATKVHSKGDTEFRDRRSNMVISDKLTARSDLSVKSTKPKEEPKKKPLFGESDLFGEEKSVDIDDGTADALSGLKVGGDDDFLAALDVKTTGSKPKASALFGDDDDDDLFGGSSGTANTGASSTADDLFSMLGGTSGNDGSGGSIDIGSYIQQNMGSGGGGLFDD